MRLLSKLSSFPFLLLLLLPLFAGAQVMPPAQFNKIYYQVTQEGWADTSQARVVVNFDAALDKVGLSEVNSHVLANLKELAANANWHITTFQRTKDNTGLEKIHVVAEARLPENTLSGLRDKAKSISKAGETYTVADVDFTPSLAEINRVHEALRASIYAQAKEEIARMNKVFPDQGYFLNGVRFDSPRVMPMVKQVRTMAVSADSAAAEPSGLSVDAKIIESAQVTIASLAPEHNTQ